MVYAQTILALTMVLNVNARKDSLDLDVNKEICVKMTIMHALTAEHVQLNTQKHNTQYFVNVPQDILALDAKFYRMKILITAFVATMVCARKTVLAVAWPISLASNVSLISVCQWQMLRL